VLFGLGQPGVMPLFLSCRPLDAANTDLYDPGRHESSRMEPQSGLASGNVKAFTLATLGQLSGHAFATPTTCIAL
jgi:hypothetical protein